MEWLCVSWLGEYTKFRVLRVEISRLNLKREDIRRADGLLLR